MPPIMPDRQQSIPTLDPAVGTVGKPPGAIQGQIDTSLVILSRTESHDAALTADADMSEGLPLSPHHTVSCANMNHQDNGSSILSDDTILENPANVSNGHSNQVSPTNDICDEHEQALEATMLYTLPEFTSNGQQVSASGLQNCSINEDEYPLKMTEVDIAEFIDHFLGTDDLMRSIPDAKQQTQRPNHVPVVAESTKQLLGEEATSDKIEAQALVDVQGQEKSYLPQGEQKQPTTVVSRPTVSSDAGTPAAPTPKKTEKRKPRTYSQAVPSQHCHICSRRPTEGSPHQVCGNLLKGRCRKTICTKCFHQFRWDLQAARAAAPGTWECPHCRGECPQRAQCVIYNRTSDRRRMKLINHRKRKTDGDRSKCQKNGPARKKQNIGKKDSPDSGRTVTQPPSAIVVTEAPKRSMNIPKSQSTPLNQRVKTSDSNIQKRLIEKTRKGEENNSGRARALPTGIESIGILNDRIGVEQQLTMVNTYQSQTTLAQEVIAEAQPGTHVSPLCGVQYRNSVDSALSQQDPMEQSYVSSTRHPNALLLGSSYASASSSFRGSSQSQLVQLSHGPGCESIETDNGFLLNESPVSLTENAEGLVYEPCSAIQNGDVCIEELLPKPSLDQKAFDTTGHGAPDDLWMLASPTDGHGGSEVGQDAESENILNMLSRDDSAFVQFDNGRLGFQEDRAFGLV